MRKKLQIDEREATSRAMFTCSNCSTSFNDLHADQLFNPKTGEFCCYLCHSVLIEQQSEAPQENKKLIMARFNEQMEPFYSLLRDVEGVKLAPALLEPEPTDIPHLQRFVILFRLLLSRL